MVFILAEQRDRDVAEAFRSYRQYLEAERPRFPREAFALATSDWYFNAEDHRCPHDAWLQHIVVQETGRGSRHEQRAVGLSIQLLGAYHDMVLTFTYNRVFRYIVTAEGVREGHSDWRYDEFRVTGDGHLLHEIEWRGTGLEIRWLIEAEDVTLACNPCARGA